MCDGLRAGHEPGQGGDAEDEDVNFWVRKRKPPHGVCRLATVEVDDVEGARSV